MKIINVEAIPYKIPYTKPLEFATGVIHDVEHVLVCVHSAHGIIGLAEAPARPYIYGESQTSIVTAINEWLAPSIMGLDITQTELIHQKMQWVVGNNTAKAAINLAVWDALGKFNNLPCNELLGGYTDRLQVSDMIGYDSPEKMVEHAQKMHAQYGITAFKIKTGRDVKTDVVACQALRKAFPNAYLYLDANHGWTANEAIYAANATADLQLAFFEEPCPAQDRLGRRRLNKVLNIPICGDESCITLTDVAREVLEDFSQMISIKTARTGFTESRKIIDFCEAVNVPVVMGNQGDTMIGSLATLHFGSAFRLSSKQPAELTNFLEISDDLLAEPFVIKNGEITVPKRPGLGIVIDDEKLKHYRID